MMKFTVYKNTKVIFGVLLLCIILPLSVNGFPLPSEVEAIHSRRLNNLITFNNLATIYNNYLDSNTSESDIMYENQSSFSVPWELIHVQNESWESLVQSYLLESYPNITPEYLQEFADGEFLQLEYFIQNPLFREDTFEFYEYLSELQTDDSDMLTEEIEYIYSLSNTLGVRKQRNLTRDKELFIINFTENIKDYDKVMSFISLEGVASNEFSDSLFNLVSQ